MAESEFYTPGVCNINPKEVAYRRNVGLVSDAIAAVLLIALLIFKAPAVSGLIVFLPSWIGAICYLQAKNHFCVSYAASGQYNASDKYSDVAKASAEQHKKDKQKARTMNIQGFVAGLVAAGLSVLVLSLV